MYCCINNLHFSFKFSFHPFVPYRPISVTIHLQNWHCPQKIPTKLQFTSLPDWLLNGCVLQDGYTHTQFHSFGWLVTVSDQGHWPTLWLWTIMYQADHRLFNTILKSQSHVLEQLLPPTLSQTNNVRKQPHTTQIPYRCSYLTDCNFFIRMLFADSYWCYCFSLVLMPVLCLYETCMYHFNVCNCDLSVFNKQILLLLTMLIIELETFSFGKNECVSNWLIL